MENARLFALLTLAMADSHIASWDAKYFYGFWRPITAIRNGDTDGNDGTIGDPTWEPLLGTPPFPEYTSGHTTNTGAATEILARFFGTDDFNFSVYSPTTGQTRSFARFSDADAEVIDARVYAGIHFRSSDQVGSAVGRSIAHSAFSKVARPTSTP